MGSENPFLRLASQRLVVALRVVAVVVGSRVGSLEGSRREGGRVEKSQGTHSHRSEPRGHRLASVAVVAVADRGEGVRSGSEAREGRRRLTFDRSTEVDRDRSEGEGDGSVQRENHGSTKVSVASGPEAIHPEPVPELALAPGLEPEPELEPVVAVVGRFVERRQAVAVAELGGFVARRSQLELERTLLVPKASGLLLLLLDLATVQKVASATQDAVEVDQSRSVEVGACSDPTRRT